MKRLLACLYLIVAYSVLAGTIPTIFLFRARATGDLWFYGMWLAALLVLALMGGLGCASLYATQETTDDTDRRAD